MPEISIADKATLDQVLGYVETLEAKLGLNTAGAGTTTVFARLAQIAGYIDTLETSLIAQASIQPTKYFHPMLYQATTAQDAWYILANVTSGKGFLSRVSANISGAPAYVCSFRITVDGIVTTVLGGSATGSISNSFGAGGGTSDSATILPNVFFNSNLKIEVGHTVEWNKPLYAVADYSLV